MPSKLFNRLKRQKGFALLEFIIYIAITGIVLSIISLVLINIFFGQTKVNTIRTVNQNARFAMDHISEYVHKAESVISPIPGRDGYELELNMENPSEDPTVFRLDAGKIVMDIGDDGSGNPLQTIPLTTDSDQIEISDLMFRNVTTPGSSQHAVQIHMIANHRYNSRTDGLAGYWTMNTADDRDNIADLSGHGNTGYLTHETLGSLSTTTATGMRAEALSFDGADDRIYIPVSSSLQISEKFTLSAWIKRNETSCSNWPMLYSSGNQQNFWAMQMNGCKLVLGVNGVNTYYASTNINNTNWHHVAIVKNGNTGTNLYFYLDGNLDGTASVGTLSTPSGFAEIGRDLGWGSTEFFGLIDDLRVYNRPLEASEISSLYNTGSAPNAGPIAHWSLDTRRLKSFVVDESGNGNRGYLKEFGATTTVPGQAEEALSFNGNSNWIEIPGTINTIKSISFFVRITGDVTNQDIIELDATHRIETDASGQLVATGFPAGTQVTVRDIEQGTVLTPPPSNRVTYCASGCDFTTPINTTWQVPLDATAITIKAWGAGGGGGGSDSATGGAGGGGGYAEVQLTGAEFTPGETLSITVGGGGAGGVIAGSGTGGTGGGSSSVTAGGGAGGAQYSSFPTGGGGGGGGYSTIRRCNPGCSFIVVAPGGGGGGGSGNAGSEIGRPGGAGGGLNGTDGTAGSNGSQCGTGGGGGTSLGGGAGGTNSSCNGGAGSPGISGAGGAGALGAAGGGGSGYYGGGGGSGDDDGASGGGGGSAYGDTKLGGSGTSPGNSADVDYSGNAGVGGSGGTPIDGSGNAGGSGRIVILHNAGIPPPTSFATGWKHVTIVIPDPTPGVSATTLKIGRSTTYFRGLLDDIRFYSRPLTTTEQEMIHGLASWLYLRPEYRFTQLFETTATGR